MESSWPSIWIQIHSWLTPAVLFLLLNLVIGTIALTSKTLLSHIHLPDPAGDAENHRLVRTASSALHRLRSLSLLRLRSNDFFFDPSISNPAQHKSDEISDVSPETKGSEKESERRILTEGEASERSEIGSSVEGVKTGKAVEEEVVEEGVDARADDFINRFRQQLHLQRLDSLLKYRDMLSGGR